MRRLHFERNFWALVDAYFTDDELRKLIRALKHFQSDNRRFAEYQLHTDGHSRIYFGEAAFTFDILANRNVLITGLF